MKFNKCATLIIIGVLMMGSMCSCMDALPDELSVISGDRTSDIAVDSNSSSTSSDEKNLNSSADEDLLKPDDGKNMSEDLTEQITDTTEDNEPNIRKLTVTATGDCSLGALQTHEYARSFHSYYDQYGEGYFMENFKDIFETDDFTLVNLECTLTNLSYDPESNPEKEFYIVGRPEYTRILSTMGVEGCSLGNNHTRDVGEAGLSDTKQACDAEGLKWAYNDISAVYETEDGYRIGFISSNLSGPVERENYFRQGIAAFKEDGVDLIICCCHWGIEREYYPTDYQIRLAHEFIDLGADLIIGNHPHVVQGVEYYNGKVICYSLGNFCFGANRNPGDKGTMVYQQTFTFVDGKLQPDLDARILPARVSSVPDYNNFQPICLEGEEKATMIERVNTYSSPYSSVRFDGDGVMLID